MSARFEPPSIQARGQIARAMAAAHAHKPEVGEYSGKMTCTRCGSVLRFVIFSNGVSYGGCNAACGVRWA